MFGSVSYSALINCCLVFSLLLFVNVLFGVIILEENKSPNSRYARESFLKIYQPRLVKGALSRTANLEKFRLNFSSSITLLLDLPHSKPALFLSSLLFHLWCFSSLGNYHFKVSFDWRRFYSSPAWPMCLRGKSTWRQVKKLTAVRDPWIASPV